MEREKEREMERERDMLIRRGSWAKVDSYKSYQNK